MSEGNRFWKLVSKRGFPFIHSFIRSFNTYLLTLYYVSGLREDSDPGPALTMVSTTTREAPCAGGWAQDWRMRRNGLFSKGVDLNEVQLPKAPTVKKHTHEMLRPGHITSQPLLVPGREDL